MNSSNLHDNNIGLSIGTESASTISPSNNQSGGFFDFLFGKDHGSYATELAVDAFNNKRPDIGCYVIMHALGGGHKLDLSKSDLSGRNLLHLLVMWCKQYESAAQVLDKLLQTQESDVRGYINVQDKKLNTPAHYAMLSGNQQLVEKLMNYGVDFSLKNDEGYYISVQDKTSAPAVPASVPASVSVPASAPTITPTNSSSVFVQQDFETEIGKLVSKLTKKNTDNTENDGTINMNSVTLGDKVDTIVDPDSDEILEQLLNNLNKRQAEPQTQQLGGAKISGKRKIVSYSEMSVSNEEDTVNSDDFAEMGNDIRNQSTEAHIRSVNRIKELLNVDDIKARAYKAVIWDAIKESHKASTNYDKSMELEKRASDIKYLNSIDMKAVEKMEKIINDKIINSDSATPVPKEEKKEKKPKKEKSTSKLEKLVKGKGKEKKLESESGIDFDFNSDSSL